MRRLPERMRASPPPSGDRVLWRRIRRGAPDCVEDTPRGYREGSDSDPPVPERVGDRVGDGPAQPPQPERVRRRPDFLVKAVDRRNVGRVWQGVVHERPGEKLSTRVIL